MKIRDRIDNWWEKSNKEEKIEKIEKILGILLILIGLITLIWAEYSGGDIFLYFYVGSFISIVLGLYLLLLTFLSLKTICLSRRIELGIAIISACLFFGAFYMSYVSNVYTIRNGFSSIYDDYTCPIISNNTSVLSNFTVFNGDLTKGIGVQLKFVGHGICNKIGNLCQEESTWLSYLIPAGGNFTFTMNLEKINNKASYELQLYNNFEWKIYVIPCSY
jgi:hypothetical protein